MPKNLEFTALYKNFDLVKEVPATYEEVDTLLGEVGGGLEGFLSDCLARNFLPRVYEDVAKKLTEEGYPHVQVGSKKSAKEGGADTPVYETDIVHVARIHDDGDDAMKTRVGQHIRDSVATLPFWAKRAGGGAGKLSNEAIERANNYIAKGPDFVEKAVAFIEEKVPGYQVVRDSSGSPTPETLARAFMALQKKIDADAKKAGDEALAALG